MSIKLQLPYAGTYNVKDIKICLPYAGNTNVKDVYKGSQKVWSRGITYNFIDLGLPSGLMWCDVNLQGNDAFFMWQIDFWEKANLDDEEFTGHPFDEQEYNDNGGHFGDYSSANDVCSTYTGRQNSRLPTQGEFDELFHYCTQTWTTQNGFSGVLLTGQNGNSIFLPAMGMATDNDLNELSVSGYYWTQSTPYTNTPTAYAQKVTNPYGIIVSCPDIYKYYGCSIRPVLPRN